MLCLSSPSCKNILLFRNSKSPYISAIPSHRGALRNVINAGRDAVDADVPTTDGTEADGEDVWS